MSDEEVPCGTCGEPGLPGTGRCHNCYEVESRLAAYMVRGGFRAQQFVTDATKHTVGMRCRDCKHWGSPHFDDTGRVRICERIAEGMTHRLATLDVFFAEGPGHASLKTHADFGCAAFEPRDDIEDKPPVRMATERETEARRVILSWIKAETMIGEGHSKIGSAARDILLEFDDLLALLNPEKR